MSILHTIHSHRLISLPLTQPLIEITLLIDLHIITRIHQALLLLRNAQSLHPKHIPLHIAGQIPGRQVKEQREDDSARADAEGHLVAVVRPLGAEELWANDAAALVMVSFG